MLCLPAYLLLQPIQAGEVVLRVPLRLAITDHEQDEESNRLLYEVGGAGGLLDRPPVSAIWVL